MVKANQEVEGILESHLFVRFHTVYVTILSVLLCFDLRHLHAN
jgi:hypothetical protein